MKIEIKMQRLRPGMESGVLCRWNIAPGSVVAPGDVMYEIETDKVVTEIEADEALRVTELIADEGDSVKCGDVIAIAEAVSDK